MLLAEDQAMVRGALSALLSLETDIEVLGAAADEAAWRDLQRLKPDLLVTDIEMPGLTGLELAQRAQAPGVADQGGDRDHLRPRRLPAPRAGYRRLQFYSRTRRPGTAEALRKVHRGGRAIDPQLALEAWSEADPLNDRERQVLRLAGEGLSAGEIAGQLNLSQGTVRNYLSDAIGKLGVGNRIEAYRLAHEGVAMNPSSVGRAPARHPGHPDATDHHCHEKTRFRSSPFND